MTDIWPWLALAGLGAFHGLNPAMGWLFAVALGLHRHDGRIVWLSLVPDRARPCAVGRARRRRLPVGGHLLVDARVVRIACGRPPDRLGALPLALRPSPSRALRHADRLVGLCVWSFLMATAHGAGLMLWPVLMPLCICPRRRRRNDGPGRASLAWHRPAHRGDADRDGGDRRRRLRVGRPRAPAARLDQRRPRLDMRR